MATKNSIELQNGRYVQGGNTTVMSGALGWWERRIFPRSTSDVQVKISTKYHRRPELLAFDVYGRATLMWVILQYNNIVDINMEFVEGKVIVLPSQSRLYTEILAKT